MKREITPTPFEEIYVKNKLIKNIISIIIDYTSHKVFLLKHSKIGYYYIKGKSVNVKAKNIITNIESPIEDFDFFNEIMN